MWRKLVLLDVVAAWMNKRTMKWPIDLRTPITTHQILGENTHRKWIWMENDDDDDEFKRNNIRYAI